MGRVGIITALIITELITQLTMDQQLITKLLLTQLLQSLTQLMGLTQNILSSGCQQEGGLRSTKTKSPSDPFLPNSSTGCHTIPAL